MILKISIFLFACLLTISAEKVRYDNFEVYKIVPKTGKDLELLETLRKSVNDFSFWNEPRKVGLPVLVMVPPYSVDLFRKFAINNGLEAEITIPNLQHLIDKQELSRSKAPKEMEWTEYHTLDEINDWLQAKQDAPNPDANFQVTKVEVGMTYSGKTIYGLKIRSGDDDTSPGVILESGIHAREWIGPAASSWVVNEILNDVDPNSVWHKFQYIYIPSLNADGYEYSHTTDRTWRKNRRPFLAGLCYGVDINRNWKSHWMEAGASQEPCAEDYAGPAASSEQETTTVSAFYKDLNGDSNPVKYDVYIAFHSFSQLLMYPWGWTGEPTDQTPTWNATAKAAVEALYAVYNTEFDYGSIHDIIYPASGSSVEDYYDNYKSKFAFAFELRDRGHFGFVLPPEYIVPSGQELKEAVKSILDSYVALPPPPGS